VAALTALSSSPKRRASKRERDPDLFPLDYTILFTLGRSRALHPATLFSLYCGAHLPAGVPSEGSNRPEGTAWVEFLSRDPGSGNLNSSGTGREPPKNSIQLGAAHSSSRIHMSTQDDSQGRLGGPRTHSAQVHEGL